MKYTKIFLSVCIASLFLTSCSKDDPDGPAIGSGKGPFLIGTTVKNPDGLSGSSYLQVTDNFSGAINNSVAYQIGFASPITVLGDDVLVFPSFGKGSTNKIEKYSHTAEGKLNKTGTYLQVPAFSSPWNMVEVSEEKAYMPLYTLGKVWIVNPKTMQKTGEIDLTSYAHSDNSPEPSYGIIRDGLYYLPLNQIDSHWMPYEDHRQADVAVIDVNTNEVKKVISETTSHISFPTRPFLKNMIFTDEQNNIYIACAGYFAYNPKYKENGFICIPAGKTEFDPAMSWDVSNTPIKGSEYKSSSVYNCLYLGNGKVAAYVGILELGGSNPNTSKMAMAVMMDMKAKTIQKIKDIPISDGHSVTIEEYNGKVVFGAYGKEQTGFFTYDPATNKTELVLKTQGNPGFFHYFGN